ncbi:hypothetical protein CspeluHIS016_0405190 [Cutaneotrichosporon spelunceum]|uniref:N-acetyltransferase domain-containing protein n=1 Tax=Cutaneotrichosporon spelunceum TaxID=1672016 RepID=A0AAD3TWC2_9TREE|nr:hypothetical protein CspeluHIS016_0405190 [Cutaneotrichosporon spelunceum]
MATITRYSPGESTDALHAVWQATFGADPVRALAAAKIHELLNYPTARVYIAAVSDEVVGWALTYTIRSGCEPDAKSQHLRGGLGALLVHPSHQNQGIGSALHSVAITELEIAVRNSFGLSTPPPDKGSIQLGSVFPRIFPGVPDTPREVAFFKNRGWDMSARESDLYGALPTAANLEQFTAPAEEKGVSFRPATAGDRVELIVMEYAEFGEYCGWPDLYPVFFDAGRQADLHLAVRGGKIIGATIAAMPGSPAHERLAFPDSLGTVPCQARLISGNACSVVACVGVGAAARGSGAGVGMTAAAIADLTRRGADGVFIDWVNMRGFYERFGVAEWWGYITASRVVR